ncbi:hypothetical protein ACFOEE_00740 [Pseudoalteromonas fenneropenaei]|uniref:Uncharacterized protein n=1 Tax=Pseudoalteromonas fenneropenaei TaxID=1737459 RepID=A0ABV7CE23_9GAMM
MKKTIIATASILAFGSFSAMAGTCQVTVTWPDGKAKSGVRVTGEVSGGGMTQPVQTDSNGRATITWSGTNSLSTVYIDGKDQKTRCQDGGSVTAVSK